jgi:hypothetical protein
MPERVVLYVEKRSLDRPAKLLVKVAGDAITPVRPWLAPFLALLGRAVERQARSEEGTVIVGELEIVVPLDASEFGTGQAGPDSVLT